MSTQAMSWSERADRCLAALDDPGRAIARRVLLRLIRFREGQADTGRPQPVAALCAGDRPDRVAETLRRLRAAQLIAIDGDAGFGDAQVELAPDTQLSWATLEGWLRSHGKTEQLRRQLESDAAAWSQRKTQGTAEVGLLDRIQLLELTWLTDDAKRELGVSEVAEAYIAASRAATRRRWWPGKSSAASALAILLILMLLATPIVLLLIVVLTASVIHRFG